MEYYLQGKPYENFQKPASVETENICKEDGLKIEYATASAYLEYFLKGTKPTKLCGIPSPTPTEDPAKKEEEDRKKKEEEDKKNRPTDTPTPAPTSTTAPLPSPTLTIIPTLTSMPTPTTMPVVTVIVP
jgi:hypothetical protein